MFILELIIHRDSTKKIPNWESIKENCKVDSQGNYSWVTLYCFDQIVPEIMTRDEVQSFMQPNTQRIKASFVAKNACCINNQWYLACFSGTMRPISDTEALCDAIGTSFEGEEGHSFYYTFHGQDTVFLCGRDDLEKYSLKDYHITQSYIKIVNSVFESVRVPSKYFVCKWYEMDERTLFRHNPKGPIPVSISDILEATLTQRYIHTSRKYLQKANIVIDQFYPQNLREYSYTEYPDTAYAISEYIAKKTGTRVIPFEDLLLSVGYTLKSVKTLIRKVKDNKVNLILVGAGGTGMNFIHHIAKIGELTNTFHIFKTIDIVDDDRVSYSNILRFPFDVTNKPRHYEEKFLKDLNNEYFQIPPYKASLIPEEYKKYLSKHVFTHFVKIESATGNYILNDVRHNPVIYGIPNMSLRQELSDSTIPYIQGSHSDNLGSVWINPNINSGLHIETYGKINLTYLFMNQLLMTLNVLKSLTKSNLNKYKDELVWEGTFSPHKKHKSMKKKYFFGLTEGEKYGI